MTRGAKKSEHNACPVCGKPRGKGPHEFSHGPCIEYRAKTDGAKPSGTKPAGWGGPDFTVDQVETGRRNQRVKVWLSGKLPAWMLER